MRLAAPRLKVEIETGDVSKLDHRRRHDREDEGVTDAAEGAKGAAGDRLHTLPRLGSLGPVLQAHEDNAHVMSAPGEAEADGTEDGFNEIALCRESGVLDLLDHAKRPFRGGTGRRLDKREEDALVLVGRKPGRSAREAEPQRGGQSEI